MDNFLEAMASKGSPGNPHSNSPALHHTPSIHHNTPNNLHTNPQSNNPTNHHNTSSILLSGSEGLPSQSTTPRSQVPTPSSLQSPTPSTLLPPTAQLGGLNLTPHIPSGPMSSVSLASGHTSQLTNSTGVSSSGGSGPSSLSPGHQGSIGGQGAPVPAMSGTEMRYGGTELVMLYDYKVKNSTHYGF